MASGKLQAWIQSTRPVTLATAFGPIMVGSGVAQHLGGMRLDTALAALFGAVFIQVGTNLTNDYFDVKKGSDREDRIGPRRGIHSGVLSAKEVAGGAVLAYLIAASFGIYLISVAGWPILLIGLVSIAAGVAYTAGRYALAYTGLSDAFVMLFYGFLAVGGSAYVQCLRWPALSIYAAIPVGSLATAVLVVNNLRDREQDKLSNKQTLAVRFGAGFARLEYASLMSLAYLVPVFLWLSGQASASVLFVFFTLPFAVYQTVSVYRRDGPDLNVQLAATGRLLLAHAALFAAGLFS